MKKKIFLYPNPDFDERFSGGISELYRVFCKEYNYNLEIVDNSFLRENIPEDKHSQILVVAGGDGTIHNAINSIPDELLDRYVFGLIPGGTANEFVKSVGLPISLVKTARIIANYKNNNITLQNVGIVNNKYKFVTGLLYGISCSVLLETPKLAKFLLGSYAYHFRGLLALLNYKKYISSFYLNSEKIDTGYMIINNANLISKELSSNELDNAKSDEFSVIYVRPSLKNKDIFRVMLKNQIHRNLLKDPALYYEQNEQVYLTFDGAKKFMLDGEVYKFNSPIKIKHYKYKLPVISTV